MRVSSVSDWHFISYCMFLQALLKIVSMYSTLALSPTRKDVINESPLKIVLIVLRKMCDHSLCRRCICSSDLFSSLSSLKQSPDPVISEYATVIISRASHDWRCNCTMHFCNINCIGTTQGLRDVFLGISLFLVKTLHFYFYWTFIFLSFKRVMAWLKLAFVKNEIIC
jgi:hypothetical protein